jgi:hypothetical protein
MDKAEPASESVRCMTPSHRDAITEHFRAIHEILLSLNIVRMSGGWTAFQGTMRDGRQVTHKFAVSGYVRHAAQGNDEE